MIDAYMFNTTTLRNILTHCGLVTPYGDKGLGQHWSRQCLLPDGTQPFITWTNVDVSSKGFCGIHPRVISWQVLS